MSHMLVRSNSTVFFNGDFSGDITFCVNESNTESREVKVPSFLVKAIVAEMVRSAKISKLEEMEDDELIGL